MRTMYFKNKHATAIVFWRFKDGKMMFLNTRGNWLTSTRTITGGQEDCDCAADVTWYQISRDVARKLAPKAFRKKA